MKLIMFLFLMFPIFLQAQQVIYYDVDTNFEIVDVSGVKPMEEINQEYGDRNYQRLELDYDLEPYLIDNGTLRKYTANELKNQKDVLKEKNKNEKLIEKEMRKQAMEVLKSEGKLPPDYE